MIRNYLSFEFWCQLSVKPVLVNFFSFLMMLMNTSDWHFLKRQELVRLFDQTSSICQTLLVWYRSTLKNYVKTTGRVSISVYAPLCQCPQSAILLCLVIMIILQLHSDPSTRLRSKAAGHYFTTATIPFAPVRRQCRWLCLPCTWTLRIGTTDQLPGVSKRTESVSPASLECILSLHTINQAIQVL